jgi:phosphatidylglycerophosphate synthase
MLTPVSMRLNLPNALTLSRLLLGAAFGYLLFTGHGRPVLVATFALAAVSDAFDGLAARRLGQTTPSGAVLDQVVDRAFTVLVAGLLIVHGLGTPDGGPAPGADLPWLIALACTREIVGLPGVAIALARRKRLYHVEWIGKIATFVQSVTLAVIISGVPWALPVAVACAVVGSLSGASYLRYSLR